MLGVLDEARSSDMFTPDASEPVRPGTDAPLLISATARKSHEEKIAERLLAAAQAERDDAKNLASITPSSTTLAALAQTHAVLGEGVEALIAARQALELGLEPQKNSENSTLRDPTSARLAAEVMLRFGAAQDAFTRLSSVSLPRSLRLTAATLAVELGDLDAALGVLEGEHGALIESFKGFILAVRREFQKAIPHLRRALRESPDDIAAAINLAVSLWELGSRRKAVATALRATRTAPGRKDASLLYLHFLLETGGAARAAEEIATLTKRGVVPDARFLVLQARTLLAEADNARALPLLERASAEARTEADEELRIEIDANVAALKYRLGRKTYDQTIATLTSMLNDYPDHEAVVVCLARVAARITEASVLSGAVERIDTRLSPVRRAYLRHQIAWIEGDNEAAGSAALAWFDLDPTDALAAGAAMVALGIGLERWTEAEKVADFALKQFPDDLTIVNNVAYVLAMAGRADEAIQSLEPRAEGEFVLMATLGLAYLAKGDVDRGMRLYRKAAEKAEKVNRDWLSLMTAYQALVVRQLGLDQSESPDVIKALALAPCPLPSDWEQHPEFVRLRNLSSKLGYGWPLSL